MSKFDRSSLLKFLRKPRCLREIVGHFEVPTKIVDRHLQEAIKSGGVLVYGKQTQKRSLNSNAKQPQLERLLYISRNSPLVAKNLAAPNSLPKTTSLATKESIHHHHESSVLSSRKPGFTTNSRVHPKRDETEPSRVFQNLPDKMKLAKNSKTTPRLKWRKRYNSCDSKSLSHIEKISLFQTLSNKPLPFLDIHRRFGISKQIIKGFVKRGFFEEVWGPKDIGVKFRLTEKGEAHLKRLEEASHFEHQQRRKIFIRLKHRIFS